MAYKGYVVELKNVRPHPNAERLKLADCFGNTVCVGLDAENGQVKLYFPTDGQLSAEFCEYNNLVRKKDDAGNNIGGYLDPDKRNIKAIKLRGEKSDGIVMGLEALAYTGVDISTFKPGDTIDVVNGHEICKKYIPRSKHRSSTDVDGNKTRKKKVKIVEYPHFAEHIDTPQLRFNMSMFKPGDIICLTEKIHGTSSRNANTLKISHKQNIFDKIFKRKGKEIKNYDYVIGSRRTIIEENNCGYYGTNEFRVKWGEYFKNKLYCGEEVFGEIAGFYAPNAPIMNKCNNKKTNDKEFIKHFGETTTFSYGCNEEKGENDYWIYRMTCSTPDGYIVEYPWDLVKVRAEQMGLKTVPELDRFVYTTEEDFLNRITKWLDVPSTIDPTHIIEGVVVRALNAPNFKVAKEKSFTFKQIEGIVKESADAPDMEEIQEIENV